MKNFDIGNEKVRQVVCVDVPSGLDAYFPCKDLLKLKQVYSCVKVEVHPWHTFVYLKEFPGAPFNSTMFAEIPVFKTIGEVAKYALSNNRSIHKLTDIVIDKLPKLIINKYEVDLTQFEIEIGLLKDCQVLTIGRDADSYFVVGKDNYSVSGQHCFIANFDGQLAIYDCSLNGTKVKD